MQENYLVCMLKILLTCDYNRWTGAPLTSTTAVPGPEKGATCRKAHSKVPPPPSFMYERARGYAFTSITVNVKAHTEEQERAFMPCMIVEDVGGVQRGTTARGGGCFIHDSVENVGQATETHCATLCSVTVCNYCSRILHI